MEVMRIRITSTAHSAFNLLPSNHDLFSSDMELAPAGHRIPPEILTDIVVRLRNHNDRPYGGMQDRDSFTPLLTCSLVCCHWAQICRPVMFKHIVIRGEAHLNRLLLLLSSPSPVAPLLSDCVKRVEIDDRGKQQKPWIHRVSLIQPHISTDAAWDVIRLDDMSYPSIYGHIPRTPPRSLLEFRRINFTDVRFRRVHDLLRIIRDLPNLNALGCKRVSFDDETVPDEDAIHIARETHIKDKVYLLYLEDYGSRSMDRRHFFLALCSAFSRRIEQTDARLWPAFQQVFALFSVIEKDVWVRLQATPTEVSCWNRQLDLTLYPHKLYVTYEEYEGNKAPETFFRPPHDWDTLETLLLDLHPTHSLQLNFTLRGETVFKIMLDAVVEGRLLQRLHAAGQVDVTYHWDDSLSMKKILALPAEYDIDGHHLVLKASLRFDLYRLKSENQRQEYLRGLVAAEQAALNPDGEAGASESSVIEEAVGEGGSDSESEDWSSDDDSDEWSSDEESEEVESKDQSEEEGDGEASGQERDGALLGEALGE